MPVGTAAETLRNVPAQPFVVNPGAFMSATRRNVVTPLRFTLPGEGAFHAEQLPQTGIVSKVLLIVSGTLTVSDGAVTPTNEWPYNLLRGIVVNLQGTNELHNVQGIDYHALRFLRYPAYDERVDVFPGAPASGRLGDAATEIPPGDHRLYLTYELPFAMDDVSLVGSLFLQSAQSNVSVRVQRALNADLFDTPENVSITGQVSLQTTTFDVPVIEGSLVTPDLSKLHGFNRVEVPFTATGENRIPLIRSSGNLVRLLMAGEAGDGVPLSVAPDAPASRSIRALSLEYAANRRPLSYNPASSLLATNNQHYGSTVPYNRIVLDFIKENPVRDAVLMAGLTELAVVIDVDPAVNVTAGRMSVVQETLFD